MTLPLRAPHPLRRQDFVPFGDVIEAHDEARHFAINYGQTERYHDLAQIDVSAQGGRPIVSLFRSRPLPTPITIEILERHPHSSQAFMPLGNQPYLVVVAPPGPLDETAIRVFLAQPGQGVNYHAGTWHHFSLALHADSDFLVIDRGGLEGEVLSNCDEQRLQQPFRIDLNEPASPRSKP
ncbi:MAG: ureidoglycolate lyase [Pseudomonadota bacterium]|nr:ureidoglycolate lyase [Pseudomonadota bacterium]